MAGSGNFSDRRAAAGRRGRPTDSGMLAADAEQGMNEFELTGRTRTHVVELERPRCTLHYAVVAAFLAMRDAAPGAGIGHGAPASFRA